MKYYDLGQLIAGYFNEDFDYWGNTIEELVRACASGCTPDMINATVADIDRFKRDHAGNLDAAFKENFGYQCDPTAWEETTEAFLNKLRRLLLSEKPALPPTGRPHTVWHGFRPTIPDTL